MSERTDISFDAALMMALRADAQRELDSLPTPKQFEEIYPDTSNGTNRNDRGLKEEKAPPSVETSTNCGIDTRNADGWCSCGQR